MTAIIVLGSIAAYLMGCGAAAALLDKYGDGDDAELICVFLWPVFIFVFPPYFSVKRLVGEKQPQLPEAKVVKS